MLSESPPNRVATWPWPDWRWGNGKNWTTLPMDVVRTRWMPGDCSYLNIWTTKQGRSEGEVAWVLLTKEPLVTVHYKVVTMTVSCVTVWGLNEGVPWSWGESLTDSYLPTKMAFKGQCVIKSITSLYWVFFCIFIASVESYFLHDFVCQYCICYFY